MFVNPVGVRIEIGRPVPMITLGDTVAIEVPEQLFELATQSPPF